MKKVTIKLEKETRVQMESLDLDLLSDFHMLDQLCTPSLGGWVK